MAWLLLSVQLMELVWVGLNLTGIEATTTDATVRTVSDIHLAYMPWSHSVATMLGVALVAWIVLQATGRRILAVAVGIGIASHLVLDLLTHAPDLQLAPGVPEPKLGLGLYATLPLGAFALELAYGVFCWWVYRGTRALLAVIVGFNIANLSLFSATVPGPEGLLANRPTAIVVVILAQIVVTLWLVGVFSRRLPADSSSRVTAG